MSVPIGSHHMPTNMLARGAREHSWGGCLLKSTARGPWRCVRVKVHQRARRLKFLCLNMPCVAQIRRRKNQPLRLNLKLEGILHSTCRAPFEAMRRRDSALWRQNIEPSTILWGFKFLSPSREWHGRIKIDLCDHKTHQNSLLLPVDKKTPNCSASCTGSPKNSIHLRHMSPGHPQQWYIESLRCCRCAWKTMSFKNAVQQARSTFLSK